MNGETPNRGEDGAADASPGPPIGVRFFAFAGAAFLIVFTFTAPWRVGGRTINRFSAPLGAVAVAGAAALAASRSARAWLTGTLRSKNAKIRGRELAALGLLAAVFLLGVTFARFRALAVNAWDFSLYFDLPLRSAADALTEASNPLPRLLVPYGHAWFLMAAFLPLETLAASPLWLVAAQALAIAAAAAAGFLFFRAILEDEIAAVLLAAAFLLCSATARGAQYVFHVEIFYPLGVFLTGWAWLRRRPSAFAAGLLLLLATKEDAFLVVAGFAVVSLLLRRGRRWAFLAAAAAAAVFVGDYRWVLPRLSPGSAAPWFSSYWARFGATPMRAAAGFLTHPLILGRAVLGSGLRGLLEPLLFLPLVGYEWLLAALPALIPYAASEHPKLSGFGLYYALPVLPFLFAAAARGIQRLARPAERGPATMRAMALVVLAVCAFDGAGYSFPPRRPEAGEIRSLLSTAPGSVPIFIQGALLPHAGYDHAATAIGRGEYGPDGVHGFLIDRNADPFPLRSAEIAALDAELSADPRYRMRASPHGLHLFLVRAPDDRIAP